MPRPIEHKDHPLSLRLPADDLAMIDRAASMRGRSRTDFMREAAVREAEAVIMETALIRMSAEGFQEFVAALDAPGEGVPEIAEIDRRRAPWEDATPNH
jgi:uncharacterized protein (DUF1778 family)